ncbi:MAG: SsrA-binding protein SmpB [Planctomycetota bacterium]|jgi:SsrA-binding protein
MAKASKDGRHLVARNKKARYRFEIHEAVEAGIVLRGTEVKSLRAGRVALADSFARFRGGELFLVNCHISAYEPASRTNHEPTRPRKLLLKKQQLKRLRTKVEERGYTLVPLSLYFTRGLAKVEIGLVSGKRQRDRRQDLKKRDAEREMRQSYR